MPFKFQGSSTVVIQPCYDGKTLPGTHQVAGDGLALLSIKCTHRDCRSTQEPKKLPTLSCAQGIMPRNSFWNLHKPDLRKVRCLECTSTDQVIELFQTHNIEDNAKSYKKKVISKLGSMISKKSKTSTQPQELVQSESWPVTCCVLSSICQETEMATHEILKTEQDEETIYKHNVTSNTVIDEKNKDTVFITLPSTNMHGNASDDFISVNKLLDPSNGDSSTKTLPFNSVNTKVCSLHRSVCDTTKSQHKMSSSILLKSKGSQHQITTPSSVEFSKEETIEESCMIEDDSLEDMLSTDEKIHGRKTIINMSENFNSQTEETSSGHEDSSIVVQSIFSELLQDIQQIKEAINFYMSSFYVQEEEYNNFPALHTSSKEVTSHFFEQIHGSLRDKNCNPKNMHSTISHFYKENAQTDCCPEQSYVEKVIDMKIKDSAFLQGNNTEQTASETMNETLCNYCFWDDSDMLGEISEARLLEKSDDVSVPEITKNSAVVPVEFIQNMWDEFRCQVETHALFMDLVNENEIKKFHEKDFPSYGHWANMYDPNIYHEAENIVHTLDSLLMNGRFPADEGNNATYIPCTVMELLDEREFSLTIEDKLIQNEGKVDINRYENISIEQEFDAFPYEKEENSAKHRNNKNFMLNEYSAEINMEGIKIHEIKLEPIFYQEKVAVQDIEYSRVPKYEMVRLDPINQQGRVDFSTLHSTFHTLKAVESNEFDKVRQNDNNTSRGHMSPKHFSEVNNPNEELFPRNTSKSQLHPGRNDGNMMLKNSDPGSSMFERMNDKNSPGNLNPAFLFSSPTVHLDLTNPYVNTNKK